MLALAATVLAHGGPWAGSGRQPISSGESWLFSLGFIALAVYLGRSVFRPIENRVHWGRTGRGIPMSRLGVLAWVVLFVSWAVLTRLCATHPASADGFARVVILPEMGILFVVAVHDWLRHLAS